MVVNQIYSQSEPNWLQLSKRVILDKVMNIEYSQPKGFIGDSTELFCSDITFYECLKGSLKSEDGSLEVFFRIHNPITKVVSENNLSDDRENELNMEHIAFINNIVKLCFGQNAEWKDYVHYYTSEDAKIKFNADSVISISLLLNKNECFFPGDEYKKNNYDHCTIIIIQKRAHGYITLYCLYDENKRNMDANSIIPEGLLRYKKGNPKLNRYEDADNEIIILSRPKQQKSEKVE
jgi:hypothetical protein